MMTLNEYQDKAMQTCMPTSYNVAYMLFNLAGEVGEVCSKVAKAIRKGDIDINENVIFGKKDLGTTQNVEKGIEDELGDVLWQVAGLCSVMGVSLETIAKRNLNKLADRQKRNVIDGNGDNR